MNDEIEVSHTCPAMKQEHKRLYDNGFAPTVEVTVDVDGIWEATVILYDRLDVTGQLISFNSIEIKCCPYCGARLPLFKEDAHDR